ncbi:U-box domain-containing protein 35-like isoform X2 [Magnolia sinica]|nr:U-box domain-containing protein 35-like isoform X2 [Magnolia sinica]
MDFQTRELLLPFQCFCSRRGLQCQEVILDDVDVPKAIISYVVQQSVDKLVLGASSRSAFARAFKQADVPTSVSKIAPDFCSVYVISKGKISSVRPAPSPLKRVAKGQPNPKFEASKNSFQSVRSEPDPRELEDIAQSPLMRSSRIMHGTDRGVGGTSYGNMINGRINRVGQGRGHPNMSCQSVSSCPSPSRSSTDQSSNYSPRDHIDVKGRHSRSSLHDDNPYPDDQMRSFESNRSSGQCWSNESGSSGYWHVPTSTSQESAGTSGSSHSMDDTEAEMRRMKLELKQTLELYETACKEILNVKQKDRDPYSLQTEEIQRYEGARFPRTLIGAVEEKPQSRRALETHATQKMGESEETKRRTERNLQEADEMRNIMEKLSMDVRYRKYTVEEIEKATDNFSEKLKIGEGGYGPVFKSTLDHTLVAIKILRSDATQGMKQFQQEIEVLSCIRHPNMVLLMGACPENGCLVYEYVANGSLEDRLFCRDNTPPLSWQLRFKIASEIATGLLFLHQTKPEPLVHRDLKPGNILLDHNFVSKIADVGLARLIPPAAADATTQYRMTAAAGTFCYIDPEYQKTGMLGVKSDIYALGIILLQLVTAAPPMGLAHNVEKALEKGMLAKMLDSSVPDWPMEETTEFVNLAMKCSELRRKDRPDLGTEVLPKLNCIREFAEQSQAWMAVSQHGPARGYQDFVNPMSSEDFGSDDNDDDIVKSPFMR